MQIASQPGALERMTAQSGSGGAIRRAPEHRSRGGVMIYDLPFGMN